MIELALLKALHKKGLISLEELLKAEKILNTRKEEEIIIEGFKKIEDPFVKVINEINKDKSLI